MNQKKKKTILVIDDDRNILDSVKMLLSERDYDVTASSDAEVAMKHIQADSFDIVLTDIKMPGISGMELLEQITDFDPEMPVVLMTAYAELDLAVDAIKKGAFDFISKPFKPDYLFHILEKAVIHRSFRRLEKNYTRTLESEVKKRTAELRAALAGLDSLSKETIMRLTAIAEFGDTDTGAHIRRVGLYSKAIAGALNMPADFIEAIAFASPLHDIGKIGINDSILLKTSEHTPEESIILKSHCSIGAQMLSESSHAALQMASSIALTHHEKWNGSGYPGGLKGGEIPIEGRITFICDQYDVLRNNRPDKEPLSHENVFRIISEGDGRTLPEHFDPDVLDVFREVAPEFDKVFRSVVDLY